jgi:Family of unknown function (DUF6345)
MLRSLNGKAGRCLWSGSLLLMLTLPASAQNKMPSDREIPKQSPKEIRLSLEQIPTPPASLPVFRLSAQKPPIEFVQETLRRADTQAGKLVPLTEIPQLFPKGEKPTKEIIGALSDGRLGAYVNLQTGDAEIFPLLARQKPVSEQQEGELTERVNRIAREMFGRADLMQKDATQLSFEKPRPLLGETAERGGAGAEVKESNRGIYLTYVTARRSVGGKYFVYGPGSRALLAIGNDGSVQGLLRRWKTAAPSGDARETRTREQIAEAIRVQLRPAAKYGEVEVLGTEIAYYDGHHNYLQPVYRFTARIHSPEGKIAEYSDADRKNHQVDDDFVIGYVPIGKEREPIPSLLAGPGAAPAEPKKKAAEALKPGDPTVGRYVVRNDDSNWVANANEFWGGLTAFSGGAFFTDSQYYWAHPFEFNTNEASFVNSVNIALNEVHGNWWWFSTLSNCCDFVDITAIPRSEGYGTANGGHLDFWVLHSCEVVPSAADAPCPSDPRPWWTPWFNIFQGVHTVVGYRTIMWIDDDVTGPFATSLRLGAPVVSAWFNATTSAAGYQGNPTYAAHCGRTPPMGRPSTVSACGRENDWIYDTSVVPPASCLINFWQPN